jgi:alpha-D-xyloside xylohydrolase
MFELYEDENDNYNYDKGICSTIDFRWNNTNGILTIDKRNGEFPGMLKTRIFSIVVVSPADGVGVDMTIKYQKEVRYNGKKIRVVLR